MRKNTLEILTGVAVVAMLLSACGTSTPVVTNLPQQASSTPQATATTSPTNTPSPTDTSVPTDTPNPTAAASPTAAPGVTSLPQTGATTSLDPCQLLPSQEATALTGVSFGTGVGDTLPAGGRTCVYGSQTTNVFTVEVVQAPDQATANAAKAQFQADLQAQLQKLSSQGLQITQIPDFADGAISAQADISAGGISISGGAFAFLKGTTFFGFSDLAVGGKAPSSDAMKTEATTVLGRLP